MSAHPRRRSGRQAAALLALGLLMLVGRTEARQLTAAMGWDPSKGSCVQVVPGAGKGCDWECPKNSCVREGATCVKDFNDCECKPGYFKPRRSRWTAPKKLFTGKGTQEARRLQDRVARMASGELGYCLAAHGRDQMGPTYYDAHKLHSRTSRAVRQQSTWRCPACCCNKLRICRQRCFCLSAELARAPARQCGHRKATQRSLPPLRPRKQRLRQCAARSGNLIAPRLRLAPPGLLIPRRRPLAGCALSRPRRFIRPACLP